MRKHIISDIVADWDEVYKKGQLTLWILIALFDGKKYAQEIALFMSNATNGSFIVTEQSLYRALRRFRTLGLVTLQKEPSPEGGTDRKYYSLTESGEEVLRRFVVLHITPLQSSHIQHLIKKL